MNRPTHDFIKTLGAFLPPRVSEPLGREFPELIRELYP